MMDLLPFPVDHLARKPISEHAIGSLIVLTPYRKDPAPLCLAVKIGGFRDDAGRAIDAAMILRGAPWEPERDVDRDMAGAFLQNLNHQSRVFEDGVFGCKPEHQEIQFDLAAEALTSSDRVFAEARGGLALGEDISIAALPATGITLGRAAVVNPRTWTLMNRTAGTPDAWIENWTWVIRLTGAKDPVRIPVTANFGQLQRQA